jgi:hypothetical protein
MKQISALLFFLMLVISKNMIAQNDCSTPYQISSGSNSFTLATGITNNDTTNDYGCLSVQSNATWLYFQVCISGSINFMLTSNSSSSTDIDFVAWGPLSSETLCSLDSSQIVDCGFSTSSIEMINIPGALSGQYYKIMVSNYFNGSGTFDINQTSGTGQLCGPASCPGTPAYPQAICKVTTDPAANHNIIIWNKDTTFTGTTNVQKETTTAGVYATIAALSASDSSAFEDTVSNPMVQSFRYRIQTTDTCGGISNGSAHTTIHLITGGAFGTGYPQLSWNHYIGFSYSTYFIFRGATPSSLALYDSISASFTTYTDVSPAGLSYYAVGVYPPVPCTPSRVMNNFTLSNTSPILFTSIEENAFNRMIISPNPANNELNISFGKNFRDLKIGIYDVSGRKIMENNYSDISNAKLDISNVANGYYLIRIGNVNYNIQHTIVIAK